MYTELPATKAAALIAADPMLARVLPLSDKHYNKTFTKFVQFTNDVYTQGPPKRDSWFSIAYEEVSETLGRRPEGSVIYTGTPGESDRLPLVRTTDDDFQNMVDVITRAHELKNA